MDDLEMFIGEPRAGAEKAKSKSSHTCEEGEIEATNTGILIPWALLKTLFAHKETTKSGKELKAYLTIPRGVIELNGNKLEKFRMGIGCYLKP